MSYICQKACTIDDELNIDGGKHVLACFQTWNYFEWIIKKLLISDFRIIWKIMDIEEGFIHLGHA